MKKLGFLLLASLFLTNCVTVNLGKDKAEKASSVEFKPPGVPFVEMESPIADAAWEDTKTGSSIAYLSECDEKSEPVLEYIAQGYFQNVKDGKIVSQETFKYNEREALQFVFSGRHEGIPTQTKLVIFRKNSCTYTLSYLSLSKTYAKNISIFDEFIKEFKAP